VTLARSLSLLKPVATIVIAALVIGPHAAALAGSAPTGGLSVTTSPAGAAVYLDGQFAGRTPFAVANVASGDHRVRVVKDGYLENARVVSVPAGRPTAVEISLTPALGASADAIAQVRPAAGGGGGSKKKWLWIGLAAGGGTAAAIVATNRNKAPTCGNVVATPATGLQSGTTVVLTAQGCTDPEGKELSYQWDLGDGGTGTGQTTTRVYTTAGTFSPKVTASDGKASATATGSVTIRSMVATWRGNAVASGVLIPFTIVVTTQSGSSLSGTYSDSAGPGTVTGTVGANNVVSITVSQAPFTPFTFTGTVAGSLDTWTGLVGTLPFTATRQ
jgi:hypothetical protein